MIKISISKEKCLGLRQRTEVKITAKLLKELFCKVGCLRNIFILFLRIDLRHPCIRVVLTSYI